LLVVRIAQTLLGRLCVWHFKLHRELKIIKMHSL
jgi:hypothetical protein